MATKIKINNEELIRKARDGDKEAEYELLEYNEKLCFHIAQKYLNIGEVEDLASIGKIGLLKAYQTFDLSKNIKFATYASRIIINEILMYDRKNKKHRGNTSLETPINTDVDGNELTVLDVISEPEPEFKDEDFDHLNYVLEEFKKECKPRDYQILHMIFYENKKQREVADELNLSQSYISRMEKKLVERLKLISNKALNQTTNRKEENNMQIQNTLVYIFENYPQLTVKEISALTGFNKQTVYNTRNQWQSGKRKFEPKINNDLKNEIDAYVNERKENNSNIIKDTIKGNNSIKANRRPLIILEDNVEEVSAPKEIPVEEPKTKSYDGPNTSENEDNINDEFIILNNQINSMSNKEKTLYLLDSLYQMVSSLEDDYTIQLKVDMKALK